VTLVKHQLQPNAQADNRFAALGGLEHKPVESGLPQAAGALAESPNTGQDEAVGLSDRPWIAGQERFRANDFERFLDAAQVAYAVVNYSEHHNVPFVERTPSMRSDTRVAEESALAADLNTASRM
jgi:hypothetical protein